VYAVDAETDMQTAFPVDSECEAIPETMPYENVYTAMGVGYSIVWWQLQKCERFITIFNIYEVLLIRSKTLNRILSRPVTVLLLKI